jgi:hypothetical protein
VRIRDTIIAEGAKNGPFSSVFSPGRYNLGRVGGLSASRKMLTGFEKEEVKPDSTVFRLVQSD